MLSHVMLYDLMMLTFDMIFMLICVSYIVFVMRCDGMGCYMVLCFDDGCNSIDQTSKTVKRQVIGDWLVVWNIFHFPIYWE